MFSYFARTPQKQVRIFVVNFFWWILFHTFCFAVTATDMMETFQKLQRSVYTNSQILSSQSNYIWAFHFCFQNALHMIDTHLKNLKLKWIFFLSKWFQLSWMTGNSSLFQIIENKISRSVVKIELVAFVIRSVLAGVQCIPIVISGNRSLFRDSKSPLW